MQQELSSGWDGRLFDHNRHGPKSGGTAVPLSWGGAGSPSNSVAWAEAYLYTKWHLDPSYRLATVHVPTCQTNRQDRQTDRQIDIGLIAYGEPFYKRSPKAGWTDRDAVSDWDSTGPKDVLLRVHTGADQSINESINVTNSEKSTLSSKRLYVPEDTTQLCYQVKHFICHKHGY